jgi:GNAT superfamily N-acetyltransferase
MTDLWNTIVVEEGDAFPQMEGLNLEEAERFFDEQTYCAVAELDGKVAGLYILHPNNVGRCGHIGNTSYAVVPEYRGQGVGRALVADSISMAKKSGFSLLQFNAVVKTNRGAINIYESMGFQRLGMIPKGFFMKDGYYEDILLYYLELT